MSLTLGVLKLPNIRVNRTLKADQSDVTSKTFNLLARVHTWPAFSNHTPGDGGSTSNSLEAIHDGIHDAVGGGGQMSDPAVAGMDANLNISDSCTDTSTQDLTRSFSCTTARSIACLRSGPL